MKKTGVLMILVYALSFNLWAQLPNAEKSLLYTQTGKTLGKGDLAMYNTMNFFSKAADFTATVYPEGLEAKNYWILAGNMIFSYGVTNHIDLSLGLRLYQDTNRENDFNLPDDVFLTLRAGSFGFARNHFQQAVLTSFRVPTGEVHNYPFAEYASGALEYGFMYAVSYYKDAYLPDRRFNMHFNIGWWNHNEKGTAIYEFEEAYQDYAAGDKLEATRNSNELRMALASVFPTTRVDFRMELTGMLYTKKTNAFVYSAEEWAFFTPSIRYKPAGWLNVDLGADFRLSGNRQWTKGIPDMSAFLNLPKSYPGWKVHLGLEFNMNLMGESTKARGYSDSEVKERLELYDAILEEQEKAELVEDKINSIRKIRQEADQEIRDLKNILED